jgi:hypothetical protein
MARVDLNSWQVAAGSDIECCNSFRVRRQAKSDDFADVHPAFAAP